MIRHVLTKLGSLRAALVAGTGVTFLMASSAFAQVGGTAPTPAAAGPTPAVASGAGNPSDSAIADSAADSNAGAGAATTERVVVTGSYIPTAETESALPVTVYTATVLQKQGANTPAEGLRQLPSFVGNTATENDSNGGDGSAFVNLRALGSGNTLTLLNGRRTFNFEDINAIPIGALSRSEVLKDGASAIYGSDAVAGVVNFILLNGPGEAPYEGAEIDMLYGNTTDTDARVLQTYIRGGVATDKVSVAAAAEYYDREAIFSRDREISATADRRFLGGSNTGSPTFPGRVTVTAAGQVGPTPPPGSGISNAARILINPAAPPTGPESYRFYGGPNSPDPFNFRLFTPAIPAMEKYQYYVTGRYKVFGDALQVYGDLLYSKRKQDNGLAPAPFGLIAGGGYRQPAVGIPQSFTNAQSTARQLEILRGSPFNPFGNNVTQAFYRSVNELGLRRSFFDYDYYRYVAGFNGNFTFTGNNFISFLGYDTGMVYERGDYLRIDSGDARRGVVLQEVIAGRFNPFIGLQTPTAGPAPTFVNGVPTGMTAAYDNTAALQNASYIGRTFNYERDFLADAKLFGNLFPNLYQGGIGFNLGYEFRHNRSKTIPDPTQAQGDQLGFNAAANNSYHTEVKAYFGELQIPVITSAMNITGVRSLEFQAAYRYEEFDNKEQFFSKRTSQFDNNGDVRLSVRYQPVQDVTLRASFGESFLSPSSGQLFAPAAQNFPQLFDPFTGQTLQPAGGVSQAGNTALKPETTETYAAGIVVTPRFLPGFTATMDVYQLFTRNVILPAADFAQSVLTLNGQGLLAGQNPPPFSDIIVRDPNTTLPFSIQAQTANAGKRLVNGMDVTAAYQLPWTNFGTFTLSMGYNYFFTWKAEPIEGIGSTNFTGDYNNGTQPLAPGAIPRHKGFLRGEYEFKGFNFVATTNYISSFLDDPAFVNVPQYSPNGERDPNSRTVSDYITLDMQASYEFIKPEMEPAAAGYSKDAKGGKAMQSEVAGVDQGSFFQRMLWGTKIRVGVVNAFDRQPPSVLGAFNDNYDTSLYSIRNRYYYIGLNKKF